MFQRLFLNSTLIHWGGLSQFNLAGAGLSVINGICQCGCGRTTNIIKESSKNDGLVAGQPYRFIVGHAGRRPPLDRFWAKVKKASDCWNWIGAMDSRGYGNFYSGTKQVMAHRASYEFFVGVIGPGLHIDHLCRNPSCVNPSHLEPVTPRENNMRGITPASINASKTECLRGHKFTEENTRMDINGQRHCRSCQKLYKRKAVLTRRAK